ncbi:MAG: hypothetical protein Fur0034_20170 [Desulfuromonadia bacterium]
MPAAAADPAVRAALKRPFAEQVAFFRGKLGNLVPTARWNDLMREQHDRAFMVAGAAKADLLADLAAAVDKAISEGESLDTFRRRFGEIVRRHGWAGWTGDDRKAPADPKDRGGAGTAWRTRVIYQTNLSTSYAAGRLAQLKEGGYALWVYRHGGSLDPRPQHLAWNGLTLPADHEFWKTHYPPSAWGCSCYVVGARSAEGAARLGGKPGYTAPPQGWNVRDAKGRLPGVDEGWDYMPGGTVADAVRALESKLAGLPQPLAASVQEEIELRYKSQLRRALDDVVSRATSDAVASIEYAALLDAEQGVLWVKRGEVSGVSFAAADGMDMRGAMLAHNHPSGRSLSRVDLHLAAKTGLRRIYAIANDRSMVYAATVDSKNLPMLTEQYDVYDRMVFATINRRVKGGSISVDEADRWHHHVVNTLMRRARIIDYRAIGAVPQWVHEVIDELDIG